MLFLRDGKDKSKPEALYLLGDDLEEVLARLVKAELRDHGYPLDDADEMIRDMAFLRAKRQLVEQLSHQLWVGLIRGTLLGIGALCALALKEYLI